jgi:hypothetical protein
MAIVLNDIADIVVAVGPTKILLNDIADIVVVVGPTEMPSGIRSFHQDEADKGSADGGFEVTHPSVFSRRGMERIRYFCV